ncbi:type III restriction-modification system endonuclease [Moraxella lacunata]|uniref:Restriction endonuclease subunit R n=1 Tax=Moraxella lacunata TaxID=477 RepID=A0A1V4GQI3_MORLA|nr:DEAD/DEAH box helicase family protein [Moraxella lacunata]OPH34668.1 restriction endonuclease subunit R [Moraxella lacunata]
MKIRFNALPYQHKAVSAVSDCFVGQPYQSGLSYRRDVGVQGMGQGQLFGATQGSFDEIDETGFANAPLADSCHILANIQAVQRTQNLPLSDELINNDKEKGKPANLTGAMINLDVEMETGTGKTYCYIRTMFELNARYGWGKFIIVVPSIAIREGVYKTLQMTAEHFYEEYHKKIRFFIYDSKNLHQLDTFSATNEISVMVINVQAFNATGKDNRRIYDELDDFGSRRPIDVIAKNRPILILDEPQKMQADKTLSSLANFKPLFILRYSATHKKQYNLVHRLDALDAYNGRLVKKITVKGIEVKGLSGVNGYLYLQRINISTSAPTAQLELEIKTAKGFRRAVRKVGKGDDLYTLSGESEQYRGYIVSEIDARIGVIEFVNGVSVALGQAVGDVGETTLRTIQIRECILAHLEKEALLYRQGIKVLSLFFIDEVAKYRLYDENNQSVAGEYAKIFEQEYDKAVEAYLDLNLQNDPYQEYLRGIATSQTHNGYFSVDKKSKRLTNPQIKKSEEYTSDDKDAYELILKDKERLLSFDEPTRFIFSHSALREGWDNPNVFVICTLKHSDNTISRRQEMGRGLRLAVNKDGVRMDSNFFGGLSDVHKVNNLTVVTNESYTEFAKNLQSEIRQSLTSRTSQATPEFFKGKVISVHGQQHIISETEAKQIHKYLSKHDFIDDNDYLLPSYQDAKRAGELPALPENLADKAQAVFGLIDSVLDASALDNMIDNSNAKITNPSNANLAKQEFLALWQTINQKATFQIRLDSDRLIRQSIQAIETENRTLSNQFVPKLSYTIAQSSQKDTLSLSDLDNSQAFDNATTKRVRADIAMTTTLRYDLVGDVAKKTNLTRKTVVAILQGISPVVFLQYKYNPEGFINKVSQLINDTQAVMLVQDLSYHLLDKRHQTNEIFMANTPIDKDSFLATKHVLDYVPTDSEIEQKFAKALDGADEVAVYAKLPDKFQIPTPFGGYNPDWAIAFRHGAVRHVYFVAETKGSHKENSLRTDEKHKIDSARRFFETLNEQGSQVKYDVVDSFERLMQIVG